MKPFSIAAVQMHVNALHSNLDAMAAQLHLLAEVYPWVQMVVFSELAPFGPLTKYAEPLPGPAEARLQEMAKKYGLWLLPGSLFEKEGDLIYNTLPVINPQGEVIGRYRKMFPFLPYEQGVESGNEFFTFDVPDVGKFGVSICYDMWFPETSRTLASLGVEVLLHPSLTTTIEREVELAMVRATAAQNQLFMFDVNGLGAGGNGQSIICGPHGDILYQAGRAEEIMPFEIDLDRVRRSRAVGLRNLGQPLKSFRDRKVEFSVYDRAHQRSEFLDGLGALVKPVKGSLAGLPSGRTEGADAPATGFPAGLPPASLGNVPEPAPHQAPNAPAPAGQAPGSVTAPPKAPQ